MGLGDPENAVTESERLAAGTEPSHREPLVDPPEVSSPAALPRLARAAAARLADAGVDVEIRPVGDGRVAILLALPWAELLVERLELEARSFKEQLRRAANAEAIRQAELHAATGEARRQQEEREAAIFAEYRRLVAAGVAHRRALQQLKQAWDYFTITDLAEIVRLQQVAKRRRAREERSGRIRELRRLGVPRNAIAAQLGVTFSQVQRALLKGGRR